MDFTEEQLDYIKIKKPELIKKTEPALDNVIVAFLEKYEVYVKPATTTPKKQNISGEIAGTAILGSLAGVDAAMTANVGRGQTKQTAVQEWTQWKQWALDHKDFPKFQTDFLDEVYEYNLNIDKTLKNPTFQEELIREINDFKDEEKRSKRFVFKGIFFLIFICSLVSYGPSLVEYIKEKNNDRIEKYNEKMYESLNSQPPDNGKDYSELSYKLCDDKYRDKGPEKHCIEEMNRLGESITKIPPKTHKRCIFDVFGDPETKVETYAKCLSQRSNWEIPDHLVEGIKFESMDFSY
tara:strand:+ start:40 stop:921 length:882 start_codon:yes stop_codon:yes gene_type:complete